MKKKIVLYELESECCGCSACEAVCPQNAITMNENGEGFLYPVLDAVRCVGCELCLKVCPLKTAPAGEEADVRRAGILCLSHKENYGAKIVAWALQSKLQELLGEGWQVGLIEYDGQEDRKFLETLTTTMNPVAVVQAADRFLSNRKRTAASGATAAKRTPQQREQRTERFRAFDETYLRKWGKAKRTLPFKSIAEQMRVMVVGSDIVFRPRFAQDYNEVYLLGCLKEKEGSIRRLSYAAAIASDDSRELQKLQEKYRDGMRNFDAISVRERASQRFLQTLTDKPVAYCCDPVLLHSCDEFAFVPDLGERGYIYMNVLDKTDNAVRYVKRLAEKTGSRVLFFTDSNYLEEPYAQDVFGDGPLEFIDRIRHADYVVTNSFHTCVFSILFHKPFAVFVRSDQSLKIRDLLDTFGLRDRMVAKGKAHFDMNRPIDWEAVDSKLAAFREESEAFLKNALFNENNK